jgi:hypothetical protein
LKCQDLIEDVVQDRAEEEDTARALVVKTEE